MLDWWSAYQVHVIIITWIVTRRLNRKIILTFFRPSAGWRVTVEIQDQMRLRPNKSRTLWSALRKIVIRPKSGTTFGILRLGIKFKGNIFCLIIDRIIFHIDPCYKKLSRLQMITLVTESIPLSWGRGLAYAKQVIRAYQAVS